MTTLIQMADYSAEDLSARSHGNKHQEMSVRRAFDLNAGLMEALEREGTVKDLKRLHRSVIVEYKQLRDLFDLGSPEWKHKDVWEWTVDHWYSGALKDSVKITMKYNIHSTNRKAIEGKVNELHG